MTTSDFDRVVSTLLSDWTAACHGVARIRCPEESCYERGYRLRKTTKHILALTAVSIVRQEKLLELFVRGEGDLDGHD